MCLITEKKGFKIAKQDIQVWKILDKTNTTTYRNFKYIRNVLYKQPIELVDEKAYNKIRHDLFISKICAFDEIDSKYLKDKHNWITSSLYNPSLIYIRKGLHSIESRKRAEQVGKLSFDEVIQEFVIPRGSRYYTDATGLYVSNRIILKNHKQK